MSIDDQVNYLPIVRAIVKGEWREVEELLKLDNNALTAILVTEHYKVLHLAIDTGDHPEVVRGLLDLIDPEILPELVDVFGRNPLQYAALVGNTAAAIMLVEKNPHLLFIYDDKRNLPVHDALSGTFLSLSQYLLKACKENIHLCQQEGYDNPFEDRNGAMILRSAINEGFLGEFSD